MKEIERKFLVNELPIGVKISGTKYIQQGYLFNVKNHVLRIRKQNLDYVLTYKGPKNGATCVELETKVWNPVGEFLMGRCDATLSKVRALIPWGKHTIEIDQFNGGFMMAEIELEREDEEFDKPDWFGEEVTYDPAYSNVELICRLKNVN